ELSAFYREKRHAILIGLLTEKKAMKLADILSDDTSIIDTFIKDKIRASNKDFFYRREETQFILNPDDGYIIRDGQFAVILSRVM
ncbi:MAG: hypothetical protein ACXVAD_10270, partial [Syntrophales bacterium]